MKPWSSVERGSSGLAIEMRPKDPAAAEADRRSCISDVVEPAQMSSELAVGTGFSASLWAYNGKNFALSEDGDTYVI